MTKNGEWLIQYIEEPSSVQEAETIFASLKRQEGYRGGRLLNRTGSKPLRIQVFFEDETPSDTEGWLPDGCRRVYVPECLRKHLGLGNKC